jgi:hypothetical protein
MQDTGFRIQDIIAIRHPVSCILYRFFISVPLWFF